MNGFSKELEIANEKGKVHFLKKGLFYTVYNFEAFMVQKFIQNYKLVRVVSKERGMYFKLGFPVSAWQIIERKLIDLNWKVLDSSSVLSVCYSITLSEEEIECCYNEYNRFLNEEKRLNCSVVSSDESMRLVQKIRNFDLLNSTPLDAWDLIKRLKEIK